MDNNFRLQYTIISSTKHTSSSNRTYIANAAITVSNLRWDNNLGLVSLVHVLERVSPALDDAAQPELCTGGELRLGGVELGAIYEPACVLGNHRIVVRRRFVKTCSGIVSGREYKWVQGTGETGSMKVMTKVTQLNQRHLNHI